MKEEMNPIKWFVAMLLTAIIVLVVLFLTLSPSI